MGKPTICLGENKGADQLRSNCEADQRLCFRYSDSTIPLHFKLLALFCACTGWFVSDLFGNHIVGFPTRRLKCYQYRRTLAIWDSVSHRNKQIILKVCNKQVIKLFRIYKKGSKLINYFFRIPEMMPYLHLVQTPQYQCHYGHPSQQVPQNDHCQYYWRTEKHPPETRNRALILDIECRGIVISVSRKQRH